MQKVQLLKKTFKVPTYRGIENPFGHVWKNVIDQLVHFNAETGNNDVYTISDLTKFGSTSISDYTYQFSTTVKEGYKKKLIYNESFDLYPPTDETYGANTSTYWCDYNWTTNSTSDRTLLLGSRAGSGAWSGLLSLASCLGLGAAYGSVSTLKPNNN